MDFSKTIKKIILSIIILLFTSSTVFAVAHATATPRANPETIKNIRIIKK